jgi:hypothetical protein
MRHLQYLLIEGDVRGETLRAMFENADFGQLRTLVLLGIEEFDSAALEAMSVACPKLEQLSLSVGFYFKPPPGAEDDVIKFMCKSFRELRVFSFIGPKEITGQGWLDGIETLPPLAGCVAVSRFWRGEPSPELLERAERARSANPKLSVLIGWADYQYNEKVIFREYVVMKLQSLLCLFPRLCDLKARRVRFPNLLEEAARVQLESDDELFRLNRPGRSNRR